MLKLLVILYYSYCLGFASLSLWKRWENGLIKVIMFIFLPGLGFVLAYYLFRQTKQIAEETENLALEELVVVQADTIRRVDVENDINLVPIQDALLLNDNKTKRKLLMHSLRENIIQNPSILKQALLNEDSETSHYAAAAIMEMKRKYQNALQELAGQLANNPDDLNTMTAYVDVLKKYLSSGLLDVGTYQRYLALYSTVLAKIIEHSHRIQHFIDKINCELELKNFDKARFYSDRFLKTYPYEEQAYIMTMKVHYTLHNSTELHRIINQLKKQPVSLSIKSLNIIRYWT